MTSSRECVYNKLIEQTRETKQNQGGPMENKPKNKQLVLTVHDKPTKENPDKKELEFRADGLILPEIIQLALAEIEIATRQVLARAPKDSYKIIEEDAFEMINMGASTLLNKLFPEISLRPDVTEDAIMDAENKRLSDDNEMKKYVEAYAETAQAAIDKFEAPLKEKSVADIAIATLEQSLPIKAEHTIDYGAKNKRK